VKILVMGGTLFNGLALVRELVRAGHDVAVCNRGRTEADIGRSVRRLVADRTDHEQLRAAIGGEDWDCVHDMTAYHPEDVAVMADILHGRTGHYVFASSTAIYAPADVLPISEGHPVDRGEAQNEYGLHKVLCEEELLRRHREHGFPATIVPFAMVFGPNNGIPDREQRMFARLLSGRPVLVPGDGTTLGQVGHVDDQARALRLLSGNPVTFGKRYNLTGAQYHSDTGYVDAFARVVGVEPERVHIPADLMDALWDGEVDVDVTGVGAATKIDIRSSVDGRATAQQALMMRRFRLSFLIQRLSPNLHRWNRSVVFSIDRLKADIGWAPEYSFEGMVEQTYEWFRREGLHETLTFDWALEDQLLALVRSR